jgi:hypothetical protein
LLIEACDTNNCPDDDTNLGCTDGRTRCLLDMVQRCNSGTWEDWTHCAGLGQTCALVEGEGFCVDWGGTDADTDTDTDTDRDLGPFPVCDGGVDGGSEHVYSCRITHMGNPGCLDYFTSDCWIFDDAVKSCEGFIISGQIDSWASTSCEEDNFASDWRCKTKLVFVDETWFPSYTYYIYQQDFPQGICTDASTFMGTVEDRPGDDW